MREEEEGRGKEGERLGNSDWRQEIRRVIPLWGGDIFYIISMEAYAVYINVSLIKKKTS